MHKFLRSTSTALCLEHCLAASQLERSLGRELTNAGLWRASKVAEQAARNIDHFRGQGWLSFSAELERLRRPADLDTERHVASEVQDRLHGLGPKQSRNFVQWLGLSRHVVPLDSRFMAHLNDIGFPMDLSTQLFQVEAGYRVVEDGINALAAAAGDFPCVYDAAVFASLDAEV